MITINSYDDHHAVIWWSSYHHTGQMTQHVIYFLKRMRFNEVKYNFPACNFCHMIIIISSYSTKDQIYDIFVKRRGLKDITYHILDCHFCHVMIIMSSYSTEDPTLYFWRGGDSWTSTITLLPVIILPYGDHYIIMKQKRLSFQIWVLHSGTEV